MQLLPDDHVWQSFEGKPKTLPDLLAVLLAFGSELPAIRHIGHLWSQAKSQLKSETDGGKRLEAIHMMVIAHAAGNVLSADALLDEVRAKQEQEQDKRRSEAEQSRKLSFADLVAALER